LRQEGYPVASNPLLDSSVVYYLIEIAHSSTADASVLYQNGKAPAFHTNVFSVGDAALDISEASSAFQVPPYHTCQTFHLEVVLAAVVDDVGDSDGDEGVDLSGVGLGPDGDDAHHEASSASVVEDFVLIFVAKSKVGH